MLEEEKTGIVGLKCSGCGKQGSLYISERYSSIRSLLLSVASLLLIAAVWLTTRKFFWWYYIFAISGLYSFITQFEDLKLKCRRCSKKQQLKKEDVVQLREFINRRDEGFDELTYEDLKSLDLDCLRVEKHINEGWECAQCEEDNPIHFDLCWNCNNTAPEEKQTFADEDYGPKVQFSADAIFTSSYRCEQKTDDKAVQSEK